MPTSPSSYTVRHLGDVCGGDHVCYLCQSYEERWRVLGQFYRIGVEKNDKMLFFQHSTPEEEVVSNLEKEGVLGIRECVARGQFLVLDCEMVYMTNGKFSPEDMCPKLRVLTDTGIAEGYSGMRLCGDMSWSNRESNITAKLIAYEAMLNSGFHDKCIAICIYDTAAFRSAVMLQVLATHPQAIINEKLLQNIYYMPPDEYLGADIDTAMLNRWMHNIEERKSIEEQLIAARVVAEKAAHAKASFLATMSHEIRNPTNGIIGSADMLSNTDVTSEQSEYVNIIQASAKHLYTVVNDVLDFSKIESGKLELTMAPLVVNDLLEDSLRLCQFSIQKNLAVSLRFHSDPFSPTTIVGDETRLRQILVNLIGNACKFTHEGEIVVSVMPKMGPISDTNEEGEGDKKAVEDQKTEVQFLEFSVSDSGVGISKEDLSKLFTKFTQIDVAQKWASTGLGLAICKQLVEAMGGKISVTSEKGKGSTFYFRIPAPSTHPSSHPPNCSSPLPSSSLSSTISQEEPPSSSPAILAPSFDDPAVSTVLAPTQPTEISLPPASSLPLPAKSPSTSEPSPSPTAIPSSSPSSPTPHSPTSQSARFSRKRPPSTVKAFDFSDDHILVVEDDITNQKVLAHMLKKLKCKVTIAANGYEAINLAKQNDYSLILTDQYMPECDGFAAVTQIRAHFATSPDCSSQNSPCGASPAKSPAHDHACVVSSTCAEKDHTCAASSTTCARRCPIIVGCTGTYEKRLVDVMDDILIKPVRFGTISEMLSKYCTNKAH